MFSTGLFPQELVLLLYSSYTMWYGLSKAKKETYLKFVVSLRIKSRKKQIPLAECCMCPSFTINGQRNLLKKDLAVNIRFLTSVSVLKNNWKVFGWRPVSDIFGFYVILCVISCCDQIVSHLTRLCVRSWRSGIWVQDFQTSLNQEGSMVIIGNRYACLKHGAMG